MPARRTTTKIKQAFVWLLGIVKKPSYKVEITKNGVTEDISSYLAGAVNFSWNSITSEIDSCSFSLDNDKGRYIDLSSESLLPKYNGGETVIISFDYSGGATRMFKGYLHAPKANRNTTRTLNYFSRKVPQLVDKRIGGVYAGDAKTLVKNIIDDNFSSIISYSNFDASIPLGTTIELTYNDYAFQY